MVYTTTAGQGRSGSGGEGAYPTVALPTVSSSSYYGVGGGGGPSNNLNGGSSTNGRLDTSSNLGLRKRDAFAIFTCLFLLRLAFNPSNTTTSTGLINFSDSSISASMELAFYSPFQSRPPQAKGDDAIGGTPSSSEKTARPVPLDIDGDGVVESMVVPVFMSSNDVKKEKELELAELQKKKRSFVNKKTDINVDGKELEGWRPEGSWGLRVLNLKPLHRKEADEEGVMAGPFAPRSLFLSPLRPGSSEEPAKEDSGNEILDGIRDASPDTYPMKLLSIQIPIERTHLGEEEKSRQRHKVSGSAGSYGKNSEIPAKDDPAHSNYDRTRHYFCGKDWHHAANSCHKHCGGGTSSECGDGETCYADTPCDAHIEPGAESSPSRDSVEEAEEKSAMALTKSGTLPGVVAVWSDGSVSLHVITADVTPSTGPDGHRTKRSRQKNDKPKLEMRQLWRVYPLQPESDTEDSGAGNMADFVELGVAFESGAIYSGASESENKGDNREGRRYGDNGAILIGGRYTLLTKQRLYPLRVSFHALDAMTGTSLWDLKGNHDAQTKPMEVPVVPITHTTSSARRRSHLPTTDTLDPELDNENAFVEGDDVMTSEECMSHFRASVLDAESGALPHEFWDDGEFGRISVGRFDRSKKFGGKRWKALGKKGRQLLSKNKGRQDGKGGGPMMGGPGMGPRRHSAGSKGGAVNAGRASGGSRSWQADLVRRAVPKRLMQQQMYKARHAHKGRPNVIAFHGREGLAVLSLKNGRPVCHISLMDHSLYADMDQDGSVDTVQVVTSPESFGKNSAVQGLIQRIGKEASQYTAQPNAPVICHALVTSGLPPREEVFTAPLCLGGPVNSARPQLRAAPPLLVEGSMGYGNDVVFAMNNGVVVRYDFNGREVWRKKGGLKDGTPSWYHGRGSAKAFLGRVQFGIVRESHSSVSASSHGNQHRPGSPMRPILLSGEDGAALISPASGKVLFSVAYPQSVTSQPLLADLNGDGTDDLLVVSSDAIWGYRAVVETGRSGGFTIVVVTLLIGVALAALVHKTSHAPGQTTKRSTDA